MDWLGRPVWTHYEGGRKTGKTVSREDWLGRPKQVHLDNSGTKVGETRRATDRLGKDRAEHFDRRGNRLHHSRDDQDILGRHTQKHFDTKGRKIGKSTWKQDPLGRTVIHHSGEYPKSPSSPLDPRSRSSRTQREGLAFGGNSPSANYIDPKSDADWDPVSDLLGSLAESVLKPRSNPESQMSEITSHQRTSIGDVLRALLGLLLFAAVAQVIAEHGTSILKGAVAVILSLGVLVLLIALLI